MQSVLQNDTTDSKPTKFFTEFLTGTIQLYAGNTTLPKSWLFCNGSAVSRKEYKRLFSVIGETYGAGDGQNTFNLPDLRGRVPVGANHTHINTTGVNKLGLTGGNTTHRLTIDQLPLHNHSAGSLSTSSSGYHSHYINDPGHDHGGETEPMRGLGTGRWGMTPKGYGSDQSSHTHKIPRGQTRISIDFAGSHTHNVNNGYTGSAGLGQEFSLMQPYQTVNYIIYAA